MAIQRVPRQGAESARRSALQPSDTSENLSSTASSTLTCASAMPRSQTTHTCPHCPRSFSVSGHLTRHIRSHTNDRPHKCPHPPCTNTYARSDNLRRHILAAHTPDERPHHCTHRGCEKKFATSQQLRRHAVLHERPEPFACPQCGKTFRKKNLLAIHSSEHTGRLPYPCAEEGCELAFLRPSALRRHMLSHNLGEKRFFCTCGADDAVFAKFSQLQRHMKEMHPPSPRECEQCGKRFRTNAALNRHAETHRVAVVDRLRHVCPFAACGAAYAQRRGLQTHMKAKHTNVNAFACEKCGFESSYRSVLKKHLRTQHCIARKETEELSTRADDRNEQGKRNKEKRISALVQAELNSDGEDPVEQELSFDEGEESSEQEEPSDDEDLLELEALPRKRSRYKRGEVCTSSMGDSNCKKSNFDERAALNQVERDNAEIKIQKSFGAEPQEKSVEEAQSNTPSTLIQVEKVGKSVAAYQCPDSPGHEYCGIRGVNHRHNSKSTASTVATAKEFNESGFRAMTCSVENLV